MFSASDQKAQAITKLIAEMICVDCQPFSIVENEGFMRLIKHLEPRYAMVSRKTLSKEIIPQMYLKATLEIKKLLRLADFVSITTDMWTSSANTDYLSITAHFICPSFIQHHISLDVIPFTHETHSADNIATFLTKTLTEWDLLEKLEYIVRDNARNFEAAMTKGSFKSIPYVAHTMQLVVKDGCFDKKEFANVLGTCRRIVGHFKHSAKATKLLTAAQMSLGLPEHRLVQDEPTRWNSTYSLLVRLIEQRKSITLVLQDLRSGNDLTLTPSNWNILESSVAILKVFFDITKTVSTASVTISEVIPIVHAVKVSLQEISAVHGTGTKAIVNDMLASINQRYRDCERKPCYAIATMLDPRFKLQIFSDEDAAESAKAKLLQEMGYDSGDDDGNDHEIEEESHAAQKQSSNPVKSLYRKILSSNLSTSTRLKKTHTLAEELNEYLLEPLFDDEVNGQEVSIMTYWSTSKFRSLKKCARKYLATPPATVFSERLFSTSGIISDKKRSRLDAERVRQLVFLCKNLPLLKYQY